MKVFFLAVVCAGLVLVGACATLSKDQCLTADWHHLGHKDGSQGRKESRFAKYQESCAEHGVVPNRELYSNGRQSGLKIYCTAENGYNQGVSGYTYYNVCPRDLESAFLKKFELGKRIYSLNWELDQKNDRIVELENTLDVERDQWRRQSIRNDLNRVRRDKDRIQRELTVLEIRAHAS